MPKRVEEWLDMRLADIYRSADGSLFYMDSFVGFHVIDSMGQVIDGLECNLLPAVRVAKNPATRKPGKDWRNLTGEWANLRSELKVGDIYLSHTEACLLWVDAWGEFWILDDEGNAYCGTPDLPLPAQLVAAQVRDASAIKQPRRPKFNVGDKVQKAVAPRLVISRLASEPTQAGEKHTYIVLFGNGVEVEKEFKEDELIPWKGLA